jgi:2-polyprenyl-3-methyl-5-hydroxy-6-metoxy-1,4-benzoquinol methylase
VSSPAQKREELAALLNEVRTRVTSRYPGTHATAHAPGGNITIPLADLMPLLHARDAAQSKMASIGTVNPRRGGIANRVIQLVKRTVARSLNWFVRDQITFNREVVLGTEAVLQALNEMNFALSSLAGQISTAFQGQDMPSQPHFASMQAELRSLHEQVQALHNQLPKLHGENTELKDMRVHWSEWRLHWELQAGQKETYLLRAIAELQLAQQKRAGELEGHVRASIDAQHRDFQAALDKASYGIERSVRDDFERTRLDYERLIHSELRLMRQKAAGQASAPPVTAAITAAEQPALAFDYQKFADRFRGPEEWVRRNQKLYLASFRGCQNVLDIGCGRGEMLEDLRAANVPAKGIDFSSESVAYCRSKGLDAIEADLFPYLAGLYDGELDGIYCSQVIEHLAPERLPEMIRLCAAKLQRGGAIILETPNPECLAIFATHFYLDPTHRRPIPPPLLSFYLEEFGFGQIQIQSLSPAADLIPQVAELPAGVVERFFGGMDYAIIARKL